MDYSNAGSCRDGKDNGDDGAGGSGEGVPTTDFLLEKIPVSPLDILPGEIWLEVFKWLENPRDLLQVNDTHPAFRELLERGTYEVPGAGKGVCILVEILPLLLKWLGKNDILNLRQVSKRVSLTVDKVLKENPRISQYESLNLFPWLITSLPDGHPNRLSYENQNIKLAPDICPFLTLNSVAKIDLISNQLEKQELKQKRDRRRIQIVGGKVRLKLVQPTKKPAKNPEDNQQDLDMFPEEIVEGHLVPPWTPRDSNLEEKMIEFLIRFSKQIRFVEIFMKGVCFSSSNTYLFLRRVIQALPNLRRVSINVRNKFSFIQNPREIEELRDCIEGHPLPPSPNLECILSRRYLWYEPLLREIANKYGGHLKYVSLELKGFPEGIHFQDHYEFPQLRYLRLYLFPSSRQILSLIDAPILKTLEAKQRFDREYALPYVPGALRFVQLVERFPQLVNLRINLSHESAWLSSPAQSLEVLERHRIRFQNLKHVTIYFDGEISNIPLVFFARLCPELVSITFNDDSYFARTDDPDIQRMRTHGMENSTIWQESNSLQKATYIWSWGDDRRYDYYRP